MKLYSGLSVGVTPTLYPLRDQWGEESLEPSGNGGAHGKAIRRLVEPLESLGGPPVLVLVSGASEGTLDPFPGVFGLLEEGERQGFKVALVPRANAREAGVATRKLRSYAIGRPGELEEWSQTGNQESLKAYRVESREWPSVELGLDLRWPWIGGDVYPVGVQNLSKFVDALANRKVIILRRGKASLRRALAERVVSLMSSPSVDELRSITRAYSAAGNTGADAVAVMRPYRSLSKGLSDEAVRGDWGAVGELALAHRGVLYVDSPHKHSKSVIKTILELWWKREVEVAGWGGLYSYPADFSLVIGVPECACAASERGRKSKCRCSKEELLAYREYVADFKRVPHVNIELG